MSPDLDAELAAGAGTVDPRADRPRRARPLAALAVAVVVVLAVVVAIADRTDRDGVQPASPEWGVRAADTQAWELFPTLAGTYRQGFPRPMVAVDGAVCFGLENTALGAPPRPSLARCVDRDRIPDVPEHGIVSLIANASGLDTWHILLAGASWDDPVLSTVGGATVPGDRIHIADRVVALRLEVAEPLATISWSIGRVRVHCDVPSDGHVTGRFCPAPQAR